LFVLYVRACVLVQVGLVLEESHYVRRQYANRQQKEARRRVWIHAKFAKAP
jgi:hypothetical protein